MKILSSENQNQDYIKSLPCLDWDKLIATTSLRIRQSLHLPTVLQMAVDEVHQLMKSDRILLYQFEPDWTGQVMVEAISSPEWTLKNQVVRDTCFETSGLKTYQENQFNAIADVTKAVDLSPCYINFLNQFQIKANLIIPVLSESKLWGLLVAHYCTNPREWLPEEINGLQQIAVHLGIAIDQASLLEQLQTVKVELESQVKVRTSELTKANQQLLQSESRFLEISESSPSVIYIHVLRSDGSIYFEHISRAIEDIVGISAEQILENATTLLDCIHPDDREGYAVKVRLSQETLQPFQHEWRMINVSGKVKWIKGNARPKLRDNGEIAWYGVVIDIGVRKLAELSQQKSEEKYRNLIENLHAGFVLHAADTSIILCNAKASDLLGLSLDQMMGRTAIDPAWHFSREDGTVMPLAEYPVNRVLSTGQPLINYVLRINHSDRSKVWVLVNAFPEFDLNHQLQQIAITFIDISDRKNIELALKISENRFQKIAASSPGAIYLVVQSVNGARYFEYASSTFAAIAEISVTDLLANSKLWADLIHPDDIDDYRKAIIASYTNLTTFFYEWRIITESGKCKWIQANSSPERRENGDVVWYGIILEVTDRKKAELETRETQNFLNSIIENIPNMVFVKDSNNLKFVRFNRAGEKLLGYSRKDLIGKSDQDFFPLEEANFFINKDREVLNNKEVVDIPEELIQTKEQGTRILHTKKIPILDESGIPKYLLGISEDITEQKKAELALKESESRFQKIALSSPGGIYILTRNLDGLLYFEYVSSAFENIFEITSEQALENFNNYKNLMHPDDLDGYHKAVNYSNENLSPFNHKWRIITPTKKLKWVQARSRPEYRDNGSMAWYGVVLDITDQMEGEQRLNQLAEHIPGMIYQYRLRPDGSSCFPYASDGIREIYGVTPEQVKSDASSAFIALHPDDLEYVIKSIVESANNLSPWYCEYRVCHENDRVNWVFGHATPQKEVDGGIIWHGYISDISDRKQTEIALAKAKEDAEAATKAKSQFLANMSHEIRTPMNGVLGMAELLASTNLTEEQQDIVQTIRDSGDTLLVIINDILDFSKIESGMLKLEEHSFVLKDAIAFVYNLFNKASSKKRVAIAYAISPDIPLKVMGDSSRLRQVLLNLVGNAVKFTQNGNINISVSGRKTENNAYLELFFTIQDDGSGIDRDRIDKLFQPFTQADASISRKYGGTGLGLVISKSLVKLMGGTIWVESMGNIGGNPPDDWTLDPNTPKTKGAIFYFTAFLKVVPEDEITSQTNAKNPQQNANINLSQLKILLAEDNQFNQKVATMMLKKLGYTVDIANNGLEVLAMLEKQFYDIIFMDMQMPEMDGVTATKIIRQTNQTQPWIIALTANVLEEDRQICLDAGMNDFVAKPIPAKEFSRIISKYSQINHDL